MKSERQDMLAASCVKCLKVLFFNFFKINRHIKGCLQMLDLYLNDVLYFLNMLWSVSDLGMLPLEATALYILWLKCIVLGNRWSS